MQRDDERPPSTGRPSLLSKQQPADADRNNILNGLEGKPARAAAVKTTKRRAKFAMGAVAGVALLVLAVGAFALLSGDHDAEPALAHAAAAAAATPITPAPAVEPAAPAPATAVIVEETAAVSPAADNTRSLKDMLNDTPETAKQPPDELTAALERPHAAATAKAKPKLAQAAEHKKTEQRAAKTTKVAQKTEPAKAKAKAAPDSDVALLAALMAHVQAGQPSKAPSTPAYQLKQCGLQNEAGAAQCRAHLCANAARKEPECKNPAPVKTASES